MSKHTQQLARRRVQDETEIRKVEARLKRALRSYSEAMAAQDFARACESLVEAADCLMWADLPNMILDLMRAASRTAGQFRASAPRSWADFLLTTGLAQAECDDHSSALATLGRALALSRKLRDIPLESTALQNMGVVSFQMGAGRDALRFYRRSLRLKEEIGDEYGEAQVLNNLASMATDDGDLEHARRLLDRSLAIKLRLRDRHGLISAYGSLGNLAIAEGDRRAARRHFRLALRYALSHGNVDDICRTHLNVGNVLAELGDLESALPHFTAGLDLAVKASARRAELMLRKGIAVALARAERYDEARNHFLALARVARKLGEQFDEAMACHDAAVMAAQGGEADRGLKLFSAATQRFKLAGNPEWQARTSQEMASVLASVGRLDECRKAVNAAVRVLSRNAHRDALAETYAGGFSVLLSTGRVDWAVALSKREQQFLRGQKTEIELARRLWEIASLLLEYHQPRRGISLLQQCVPIYKRARDDSLLSLVRSDLARARAQAGQTAAARLEYEELLRHSTQIGDRVLQLQVMSNLAEVTRMQGDATAAASTGLQALGLARRLHDLASMPMILNNLGLAFQDVGDRRSARTRFSESAKLARQVSDADAEARALSSLGSLEHERQRYDKALSFYDRASLVLGSREAGLTAQILTNRLASLIALGRSKEASDTATKAIAAAEKLHDYESIETITWQVANANLQGGSLSSAADALVMGFGYALLRGKRHAAANLARWVPLLTGVGEAPYDRRALLNRLRRSLKRRMPSIAKDVRRLLDQIPTPRQLERDLRLHVTPTEHSD
jgi:tetratricopeptide (TPR) repeat protein